MTFKTADSSEKIESMILTYNFKNEISFHEITINQRLIIYTICLVDENNIFLTESLNCGISLGYLYFTNDATGITFFDGDNNFRRSGEKNLKEE